MAAPTAGVRVAPGGIKLENGHSLVGSRIDFSLDHDVSLWEIGITPPGYDGGEALDQTTQWNEVFKTKSFQALIDMTDGQVTAGYDPAVRGQLIAMINKEQTVTITYTDGSKEYFYGGIRQVSFDPLENGTVPMLTATFTPTNADPTSGDEEAPAYTLISGT